AGDDPGQLGAGDVRDHLLPPVVLAGALGRTVRPAGKRESRPRSADRGATRADPRPRRPAAGGEPYDERGADRALGAAAGGGGEAAALPPPGAPLGDERRARAGAGDQGAHGGALRTGDDQDGRGSRRADGAGGAPERIPGRDPAAGLDPRLPVWRDG